MIGPYFFEDGHSVSTPLTRSLPLGFLMGVPEVQRFQGKQRTIPKSKEAIQHEIAAIPATMLTNVVRNFNDSLQE